MTDYPDGSGPVRRTPRAGEGGAPVSGALAIVLAVIAVLAGFFILRSISDGGEQELGAPTGDGVDSGTTGDDGTDTDDGTDDTATGSTTVTTVPPTTVPPFITEGANVIVANANSQSGSAGAMTRALEAGPGFLMVDPTNANSSVGEIDATVIYFDTTNPAAQGVANSVAQALGGVESVLPLPTDPLTQDGELRGATVLVMLGNDKANKTLEELNPASDGVSVATNPPVASEDTTE